MGKKGKGQKKDTDKDPFEDLAPEFRAKIDSGSVDAIKEEAGKVAVAQEENLTNKEADVDLKEKQAIATEAGAQYREATKANRLKMKYIRQALQTRGSAVTVTLVVGDQAKA